MTDTTIAQVAAEMTRLNNKLIAKGYRFPECEVIVKGHKYQVWISATAPNTTPSFHDFARGDTLTEQYASANAIIDALPSVEDYAKDQFIAALGRVIDQGREAGVDIEWLNPLVASMKALSENILTDQRASK